MFKNQKIKIKKRDYLLRYYPTKFQRGNQAGFTLLLAALAASIALTLGASIFSISSKQIQLSALGRDSQIAFYTADTAVECAYYWDLPRYDYFGTSIPVDPPANDPKCGGQSIRDPNDPRLSASFLVSPGSYVIKFQFEPNNYCANVIVAKCAGTFNASDVCVVASPATLEYRTRIRADGYNVRCNNLGTNQKALERSVELSFE